jgi:hypothetical protein
MGVAEQAPSARTAGQGTPRAEGQAPITIPRGAYAVVTVIALLLGVAAIVRGTRGVMTAQDSDLTNFYLPSADQILHGHLFGIYNIHPADGFPNDEPPISIFLVAPLLALARAVCFAASPGEQITFIATPFLIFVPALGYATIVALRRLFPEIPETQRFLSYLLILFSPLIWEIFTTWYHVEQPLMLVLLVAAILAFQTHREELGGLLAGLALLTRTTALFPLLGFVALLLIGREWRGLLRFGGVAAMVTGLGLAPFFLFDRRNALYSLVTWRGGSPIGGNSIWSIFLYQGTATTSHLRYSLDHLVRRLDTPTIALFIVVAAFLAVRRLRASAYGPEAWAVLTVGALALPLLTKRNWPYYYLEPFVLLLIWEFATMHNRRPGLWRWPVLTFGYVSVAATLSQFIGLQSVGTLDRVAVGLVNFVCLGAFVVAIWYRTQARVELARAASAHGLAPAGAPGASGSRAAGMLRPARADAPVAPPAWGGPVAPAGPGASGAGLPAHAPSPPARPWSERGGPGGAPAGPPSGGWGGESAQGNPPNPGPAWQSPRPAGPTPGVWAPAERPAAPATPPGWPSPAAGPAGYPAVPGAGLTGAWPPPTGQQAPPGPPTWDGR